MIVSKRLVFWVCTFIKFTDSSTYIRHKHLHIIIGCLWNQFHITFTIIKAIGTTQNVFRLIHKLLMSDFSLYNNYRNSAKKVFLLLIHIHLVVIHIFVSSDKPERLHLRLLILKIKVDIDIVKNYIYIIILYTFTLIQKLILTSIPNTPR